MTLVTFGCCCAAALLLLLYQLRIKRKSNELIATLHILKRELASSFELGTIGGNVRDRRTTRPGRFARRMTSLTLQGMKVVHHSVQAAKRGKYGFGETLRIVLNASEVTAHLYGTLA